MGWAKRQLEEQWAPERPVTPEDLAAARGEPIPMEADYLGCLYCDALLPEPPHRAYVDPCPWCGYAPD